MSNSNLVSYTKMSPFFRKMDGKVNKKITIHHMAGDLSVETCGNVFQSSQSSANYGIGSDGRIGLYVDESNRAWATANPDNDCQSVNIEVANDEIGGDWHVSDKALAALIDLCVDICQRNGIEKLIYTGDASGNLTRHNMFIATACPGPYLQSKFPWIAETVNERLSGGSDHLYRVRRSWADAASQIGAFAVLENAKNACKSGYVVYDENGAEVYRPMRSHKVVSGDTLWDLAEYYLGSGSRYKEIMSVNDLSDSVIHVGQILEIPDK